MIGTAPTFSVTDFVEIFNQSLAMTFPEVAIIGELADFRISKNRWTYFDLKDDASSVKFFGSVYVLPGPLESGMMLSVSGRPYLHPQFGFSVQVESIQVVGEGAINKAQQLLKAKLEREGLFDYDRKRQLPMYPEKIALIASGESAGYSDFIKVSKSRWPILEIDHYETNVQGADAPKMIVEAIKNANQGNYDVVVITRGGGAKADLSAFDHEQVVRAIASTRAPSLVAVGHERDVVLAELVADVRASTPSNAAEILVPDVGSEKKQIILAKNVIENSLRDWFDRLSVEVRSRKKDLASIVENRIEMAKSEAVYHRNLLRALDPNLPLEKGYVIARDRGGKVIKTVASARSETDFELQFKDGKLKVRGLNDERE